MHALNIVVKNIFRKAQLEKKYTMMYGKLCEEFISLELVLKGQVNKLSN